jgi:hypothetical protein
MKKTIWLCLISVCINCYSQDSKGQFNFCISKINGDLNKDGIIDLVKLSQDTTSCLNPYRIEIYFGINSGKAYSQFSSNEVFELEAYCKNEYIINIKKGLLLIENSYLKGSDIYKFRFQNNKFELIGFTHSGHGGYSTNYTDFNLLTGFRLEEETRIGESTPFKVSKTKRIIRPLPTLKNALSHPNVY